MTPENSNDGEENTERMNETYTVSSERLYEDVASEKKQALCKVEEVSAKMTILMSKSEGKKKSEHSKRRG